MNDAAPCEYALCFRSLFHSGRGFSFPCDARGQVHLDALSERARNNYLYARAMVGRELTPPSVERREGAHAGSSPSTAFAAASLTSAESMSSQWMT